MCFRRALLAVLLGLHLAACPAGPEAPCSSNAACLAGELCVDGRCQKTCHRDPECAPGLACVDGICAAGLDAGGLADVSAADVSAPEGAGPDAVEPDAARPDASPPDASAAADALAADASADAALPDSALADVRVADAGGADAAVGDVAGSDHTVLDATAGDASTPDAAATDGAGYDAVLPAVLLDLPMTADLQPAQAHLSPQIHDPNGLRASPRGIWFGPASTNRASHRIVAPAWVAAQDGTFTADVDTLPSGHPAALVQGDPNRVLASAGVWDHNVHRFGPGENQVPCVVAVSVRNSEVTPSSKVRLVVRDSTATQFGYDFAFDNPFEPYRPGTISAVAGVTGVNEAAGFYYEGDGYYRLWMRGTSAPNSSGTTLGLRIQADRDLGGGAILAGDVSFTAGESRLQPLVENSGSASTRPASDLHITGLGLPRNDLAGRVELEIFLPPESGELPILWLGNQPDWDAPGSAGCGVFLSNRALVFRKVRDGAVVAPGTYHDIIEAGSGQRFQHRDRFVVGFSADDSRGIALHINGPRFHSAMNFEDIADASTLWIGGDGSEYANAWLRDLVVYSTANGPQDMVANADPVAVEDKLPGYIMAIAAGGKVDTIAEMLAELAEHPNLVGVQKRFHWGELETAKGVYDFTELKAWLDALAQDGRDEKLVVMLEERTFNGSDPLPAYLHDEGHAIWFWNSASSRGYTGARWRHYYWDRFSDLLRALLAEPGVGDHPNFGGINTQETAGGYGSVAVPEGSTSTTLPADFSSEALRDAHLREIQLLASQLNAVSKPYFFFQNYLHSPSPGDDYLDDIARWMRPYRAIFSGPDMFPDDSTQNNAGGVVNRVKPRYQLFEDGTLWKAGSWQNISHQSTTDDTANHPLGFHSMRVMFDEAVVGYHVNTIFINTWNGAMNRWEGATAPYTNSADVVDDPARQPPFQ